MYIRSATLTNFRGFESLKWELADGEEPGWHVLLGPNGSGKSSFLRALAIALTGPREFTAARRPAQEFVRRAEGVQSANIELRLCHDRNWDAWSGTGRTGLGMVDAKLTLTEQGDSIGAGSKTERTIWGQGEGWFSAAFGPMRRFAGGNLEHVRLFASYPRLARHLSIFGEDVALTEALEWLRHLRFRELEQAATAVGLLPRIRALVNQPGFLPHGAHLTEVTSEGVMFVDGNGIELPVVALSDGYRAVLSMTFELIRLMASQHAPERLFAPDNTHVLAPGVVLVDEMDAHLHPSWQRDIGPWFRRLFPAVQFIVTTHSPYVCQSARPGSVWRMPAPGSGEAMRRIEGPQLDRVLLGDVLQVLNSEAFDGVAGRSDDAMEQLELLARLRRGAVKQSLSETDAEKLKELENRLSVALGPDPTPT